MSHQMRRSLQTGALGSSASSGAVLRSPDAAADDMGHEDGPDFAARRQESQAERPPSVVKRSSIVFQQTGEWTSNEQ